VSCSEGQRACLDDAFHDEGGVEAQYAREGCEVLVVELRVGGQVAGDDAQEVVRVAEQALGVVTGDRA
jgi:hypothetical protein